MPELDEFISFHIPTIASAAYHLVRGCLLAARDQHLPAHELTGGLVFDKVIGSLQLGGFAGGIHVHLGSSTPVPISI